MSSPASSEPSRPRAADVLDAALTLFAQRGYHGTTMSQIAAALGVRVPTLYSHIRSKQGLLAEIVVETTDAVWDDYRRVVAGLTDPAEKLRRAVEVYALRHASHPRQAVIVNRDVSSLEETVRSQVLQGRERHERAIRGLVAEGAKLGVFDAGTPSLASFAILEMSVSIARWFRDDGPLSAEEVARRYSVFALRLAGADA